MNQEQLFTRKSCRVCYNDDLTQLIDLGKTPLADAFVVDKNQKKPEFPLRVFACHKCGLVQLIDEVNSELLFGDDYAFYTGASPSSIAYFKEYAEHTLAQYDYLAKKGVLEIASNDGTLLKHFLEKGYPSLGIDPAKNVVEEANQNGIPTFCQFFNLATAQAIEQKFGIIMANNVVAHVDDLHDFFSGIKEVLHEDGVFIFEAQYFPHLFFRNQFDNIYHEHRSFLAVRPIARLCASHGLQIVNIEEYDTQGGSIRVYIRHMRQGLQVNPIVNYMLGSELAWGFDTPETYKSFEGRIQYLKENLLSILHKIKKEGKVIYGYGASAKGNTLLNYCGITTDLLDCIVDKTPYKIGKYTPGTHIPVQDDDTKHPDYYLLLVWNYLGGIIRREKDFLVKGGRFIVPIPMPIII